MIYPIHDDEYSIVKNLLKKEFHSDLIMNPFQHIYIYKEDNSLSAFIIFDIMYERAELTYIYVAPIKRNRQIASLLMDFMFENLKDKKVKEVSLEVSIKNEQAVSLYKKYGFEVVAKRDGYYEGVDALLMVKEVK